MHVQHGLEGNDIYFFNLYSPGDFAHETNYTLPGELIRRYGPIVKLDGLFKETSLFLADPDAVQQVRNLSIQRVILVRNENVKRFQNIYLRVL